MYLITFDSHLITTFSDLSQQKRIHEKILGHT